MEQQLIRFVKFHGFKLAFNSLKSAFYWGLSLEEAHRNLAMETPLPFGYEPAVTVVWLLPLLWSAQGFFLIVGVIRGYPSCMRLLNLTSVVTIVLEFTLLFVWYYSLDLFTLTEGIIYLAYDIVCSFYILYTLEQMFADLEKKRQEADVINAIVCEGGDEARSKQLFETTRHLPVVYAIGAIQALRKLFRGWYKKSGKVGTTTIESEPISATEMARQCPPGE